MGVLIEGVWRDQELPQETGRSGEFQRADSRFRDRITADGSSGLKAEAGRYHLYVAHGCPWAHRTLIFRALKKLENAITVAYAVPGLKEQGWTFENNPAFPDCTPDTINGFQYLHQAYSASKPHYTGKVTVPTLWDTKTKRIVNNESSEIIRMLNGEFKGIAGTDVDFYPAPLRAEIDRMPRMRPPMTPCLPRSTSWRRGSGGNAILRVARSPRPIGDCFPRWYASTSPISRCSSATRSASPITPIS